MLRLLLFLAICIQPSLLFSGDHKAKMYKNHVYFFAMDLPGNTEKTLAVVEPKPPQPAHGFSIEIDRKGRSIHVYLGYNATFQENTVTTFLEWLQEGQARDMKILSCGSYAISGLMGFRAILIPSSDRKNGAVLELIRIHRKSKDGSPGIWYEFRLSSDLEHYIEDSNLFSRLMFSFRTIKSKDFE